MAERHAGHIPSPPRGAEFSRDTWGRAGSETGAGLIACAADLVEAIDLTAAIGLIGQQQIGALPHILRDHPDRLVAAGLICERPLHGEEEGAAACKYARAGAGEVHVNA